MGESLLFDPLKHKSTGACPNAPAVVCRAAATDDPGPAPLSPGDGPGAGRRLDRAPARTVSGPATQGQYNLP